MSTSVVQKIANAGGVGIPVSLTTSTGATTTEGILLGTTETATVGAQKFSPSLHFQGSGWKTDATAGAQSCDWKVEVQPVQGTANPWSELVFGGSINGGAYKKLMSLRHGFQTGSGEDDTWAEFRIGNMTDSKSGQLIFTATTDRSKMSVSSYAVQSDFVFTWSNSSTSYATADTGLSRVSAGVVGVGTGAAGSAVGTIKAAQLSSPSGTTLNVSGTGTDNLALGYLGTGVIASGVQHKFYANSAIVVESGNAAQWIYGQNSELLTISTSGLTTDTTANLLPADSIIEAVVVRITTTISGGGVATYSVGDPTTATRFRGASAVLAAGSTLVDIDHWSGAVATLAAGPSQASAAKVRITCAGGTPTAGAVRITVFYRQFVAPTS